MTDLPPSQPPAGAPPPPAAPAIPFRWYRSRTDRRLGGVAGGLAVVAGVDPTLVRLAMALGAITGWGLLGYFAAWIILKEEDPGDGRVLQPAPEGTQQVLRIGLAVLGALGALQVLGGLLGLFFATIGGLGGLFFDPFFPTDFGPTPRRTFYFGGRAVLGLLLLTGGLLILLRRRPDRPGPPPARTEPPAPPPPPAPVSRPGRTGQEWLLLATRAVGWLAVLWFLFAWLALGGLWAAGAVALRYPLVPFLAALGAVAVLVAALVASRRIGVLAAALVLLVVPAVLAAGFGRWDGRAGYRSSAPAGPVELEDRYRHSAGAFDLDLSELRLPPGRTEVVAELGVGRLTVVVPWDANVTASAKVGVGRFELLGRNQAGFALEGSVRSGGQPGAPLLALRTRAGVGAIEVYRAAAPAIPHEPEAPPEATSTVPPPEPEPSLPREPGTYVCEVPPDGGAPTCRPA